MPYLVIVPWLSSTSGSSHISPKFSDPWYVVSVDCPMAQLNIWLVSHLTWILWSLVCRICWSSHDSAQHLARPTSHLNSLIPMLYLVIVPWLSSTSGSSHMSSSSVGEIALSRILRGVPSGRSPSVVN
jgi:hypothetical protein